MRLRVCLLAALFALNAHAAEPSATAVTPLSADSLANAAALRDQHVEAGAAYAIV